MAAAVGIDMCKSFLYRGHGLDAHGIVHELSAESVGCGRVEQGIGIAALQCGEGRLVGKDADVFLGQRLAQCGQVGKTVAVDDKRVEGIAY